jgi:hypothetical protein
MMMLLMMMIVGAPPIRHACVPCCWAIRPPLKFKVSLASSSVNPTNWKTRVKGLDLLSVARATAKEISVGDDKQQEVNIAVDGSESTGGASSVSILSLLLQSNMQFLFLLNYWNLSISYWAFEA